VSAKGGEPVVSMEEGMIRDESVEVLEATHID
jgi:hypothetical protein